VIGIHTTSDKRSTDEPNRKKNSEGEWKRAGAPSNGIPNGITQEKKE
jgi:hypothetical protein